MAPDTSGPILASDTASRPERAGEPEPSRNLYAGGPVSVRDLHSTGLNMVRMVIPAIYPPIQVPAASSGPARFGLVA